MATVPRIGTTKGRIDAGSVASPRGTAAVNDAAIGLMGTVKGIFEEDEKERAKAAEVAREALEEAELADEFISASSDISQHLTDLEDSHPGDFRAQAESALTETLKGVSQGNHAKILKRGVFAIDAANARLTRKAATERRGAARKNFTDETVPHYAELLARADISGIAHEPETGEYTPGFGNELEVSWGEWQFAELLDASPNFNEDGKAILFAQLEEQRQKAVVNTLIDSAIAEPVSAQNSLDMATMWLDEKQSPSIESDDRLILRRSIETTRNAIKARQKEEKTANSQAFQEDLLQRAFNGSGSTTSPNGSARDPESTVFDPLGDSNGPSQHRSGFPTIPEVVNNPDMTPAEKRTWIGIIEQHNDPTGGDPKKGIPAVELELTRRVYDPNHPHPITTFAELTSYLGPGPDKGLGLEHFGVLKSAISKQYGTPKEKRETQALGRFLTAVKPWIVTASMIPNSDPLGMAQFNDFDLLVREAYNEGLARGLTPEVMLTRGELTEPLHPDSLWRLLPKQSLQQKLEAALRILDGGGDIPRESNTSTPRGGGFQWPDWLPSWGEDPDTTPAREVKQRIGVRENANGSHSTHLMRREYIAEENKWVAFPSLMQDADGTWVDMSDSDDWRPNYEEALKRGEVYDFGSDEAAAIEFADKGSWKDSYQTGKPKRNADSRQPWYQDPDNPQIAPPLVPPDEDEPKLPTQIYLDKLKEEGRL